MRGFIVSLFVAVEFGKKSSAKRSHRKIKGVQKGEQDVIH
jgi:hypothetical protein